MLTRFLKNLLLVCVAWRRSRSGIAAVEFAIVFPVALILYVGAAEVSDAVNTSRKVETVSRTIVDLLSQQPTSSQTTSTPTPTTAMTATALQNLMTAATGLLNPAPTAPLKMTLSAIDITNNSYGVCCKIRVRWSYTQNGTLRPCNVDISTATADAAPTPTTIPANLAPTYYPLPSPISLLVADVSYTYQPIVSVSWLSFSNMSRTSYILPRSLGQVITQSPLPASGAQTGAVCY